MQKFLSVCLCLVATVTCLLVSQAILPIQVDDEPFAMLDEPNGRLVLVGKPDLVMAQRGSATYMAEWQRLWFEADLGAQFLVDPKTGVASKIPQAPDTEFIGYHPTQNLCFFWDEGPYLLSGVPGDKTIKRHVAIPAGIDPELYSMEMTHDATIWAVALPKNLPSFKLAGGTWVQEKWQFKMDPDIDPGVYVVFAPELDEKSFERGQVLQISFSEEGAGAVVTTGVTDAEITPDGKFLFFQSQGFMFVSKLTILTGKAAQEERTGASKEQTMLAAKQVALALILYSSDNDDVLPAANQYEAVLPYLKTMSLMQRFTYTYAGPLEYMKIEEPSNTVLGYVLGTGGRAVAYADGHVKWIPDAEK